jgi:hypothetical protein
LVVVSLYSILIRILLLRGLDSADLRYEIVENIYYNPFSKTGFETEILVFTRNCDIFIIHFTHRDV